MTAPAADYALPPARSLPPGVDPGPGTPPAVSQDPAVSRARYTPPDAPGSPGEAAQELCLLLGQRGVSRVIHKVDGDRAVVSLPEITVWITSLELSWTHGGAEETWPAGDLAGAAEHLARLAHARPPEVTSGVPWEGGGR